MFAHEERLRENRGRDRHWLNSSRAQSTFGFLCISVCRVMFLARVCVEARNQQRFLLVQIDCVSAQTHIHQHATAVSCSNTFQRTIFVSYVHTADPYYCFAVVVTTMLNTLMVYIQHTLSQLHLPCHHCMSDQFLPPSASVGQVCAFLHLL